MNINKYFHMIPLWKSPIKLPIGATRCRMPDAKVVPDAESLPMLGPLWGPLPISLLLTRSVLGIQKTSSIS